MQERALNCLKNLLNGKAEHIRAVAAWAADQGNPGSGLPNLLAALAAPLQPTAPAAPAHARQALFAISNICSGKTSARSQRPPARLLLRVPLICHPATQANDICRLSLPCTWSASNARLCSAWSWKAHVFMLIALPACFASGLGSMRRRAGAIWAAGEEEMQQAVMASGVVETLVAHLSSDSNGVREAGAWCVLNLAFTAGGAPLPAPVVRRPSHCCPFTCDWDTHMKESSYLAQVSTPRSHFTLERPGA